VHRKSAYKNSIGSVQNKVQPGSESPAPAVSTLANLYFIGINDRLLWAVTNIPLPWKKRGFVE